MPSPTPPINPHDAPACASACAPARAPATALGTAPGTAAAIAEALTELALLGLPIARAASRLGEIEQATLDILAPAARQAAEILVAGPTSLEEARRVGNDADVIEAMRDAAALRLATVAGCYDKTTRAVRRTATLAARLATGKPFRDLAQATTNPATLPTTTAATQQEPRPTPRPRPANDVDPTEPPDPPESGDEPGDELDEDPSHEPGDAPEHEPGHSTADQVLRDARRDLEDAQADIAPLMTDEARAACRLPPQAPAFTTLRNSPPGRRSATATAAATGLPSGTPPPSPAPDG